MQKLKTHDELQAAERAAAQAFAQIGLTAAEPFTSRLAARTLIYPIDYTMLSQPQFEALVNAAALEGDEAAYVVPYASLEAGWSGTYDHRRISLDFADYKSGNELILEHLIYPSGANWAIATFDGEFAAAGGSQEFITTLRDPLPDDEEDMALSFLRDWEDIGRGGANIDWLYPLVAHLFGDSRANELRRQT
jgi:hypothetical protein